EFAARNNLQEQVPILDEIAGIALLERTIKERRLKSLLETVSLEPKRIITEGQRIGLAMRDLRTTNKISIEQLAEKLQVDHETLKNFERGNVNLDLNGVKAALLEFGIDPEREENVEKMNKLEEARLGQNLLRDLAPEDISIFHALDFVRLSTMLTEEDFAVAAGIPVI